MATNSFSFVTGVVYSSVEDMDSDGNIVTKQVVDREATTAAFLTALEHFEENRINGGVRMREAIAAVLERSKDKDGTSIALATPEVAFHAALALAANPHDLTEVGTLKDEVAEYIKQNSADDESGYDGKLYLSTRGKGGGLRLLSPALIAEREILAAKKAEAERKRNEKRAAKLD